MKQILHIKHRAFVELGWQKTGPVSLPPYFWSVAAVLGMDWESLAGGRRGCDCGETVRNHMVQGVKRRLQWYRADDFTWAPLSFKDMARRWDPSAAGQAWEEDECCPCMRQEASVVCSETEVLRDLIAETRAWLLEASYSLKLWCEIHYYYYYFFFSGAYNLYNFGKRV